MPTIRARLGVDSYTIRASRWDGIQTLDYAAKIGLDTVQFSELPNIAPQMEKATDEGFLRQVRAHGERLGIHLEMGTWAVCPTTRAFRPQRGSPAEQLRTAIRAASIVGATVVRCVVGGRVDRAENGPIERHIDAMIAVCRSVRDEALRAGLKIAIENHQDLRAREMRYLVEQAGPDYAGVCLDTGNPVVLMEDPLETVEILAPYAVSSHFRDSAVWRHPRGAAFQWVPMGDGNVGIDNVVREFVRRCPNVSVNLEIITGRPPVVLSFLEPDFWQPFQKVPAKDFARFVALAERGVPREAGPPGLDNNAEHQRTDLEQSVRWCREALGIAWRG